MNTIPLIDHLGSTRWHWRMRRWKNNARKFASDIRNPGHGSGALSKSLIFLNLIFFTLMVLWGTASGRGMQPLLHPDTNLLIYAGGQHWYLVLVKGEWWRCITYAFTHGGLIHLAFNMVVLYQVGPLLEFELGAGRYLFLYTLTALTATIAGYFWHPATPVVGASGSLFGLIGFSIVYFHRLGPAGVQIRDFMFKWAIFAFIFGLLVGADNAGHLGGALGGAILGFILPLSIRSRKSFDPIFNVLGGLSAALIVVSLSMLVLSWFGGR